MTIGAKTTLRTGFVYMMTLTLILSAASAAVMGFYYFNQGRLLYQPSATLVDNPATVGLTYQDLRLVTEDNVELHAWFVDHPAPRFHLLFFHGNAGNMSHRLNTLRAFHALGAATLIIDYRGYGHSAGQPSETGTYRDASAAWRYLTDTRAVPPDNIVLYGRSLGGAVAAELASRVRPRAVVMESSFHSLESLAAEMYPWLPTKYLLRFRYPSASHLRRATCPVLVAHSAQDQLIPLHHGRALFEAAREPRYFYRLNGSHNSAFSASSEHYLSVLEQFFSEPGAAAFGPGGGAARD